MPVRRVDRRLPDGFTLVELMVVIAVIGVLVALLLPAVQAARESARQTTCRNNLKQVGLGLHLYHNTHQTLPTGCVEWRAWNSPPGRRQFAWSAMLLPFIEQSAVHDRIDFAVAFDHVKNAPAAATTIATYLCPSAGHDDHLPGRTDYGGLFGESIRDRPNDDGLFLYERSIRFAEITDGLSHTMAVSEDIGGPDSQWINGRNVFVQSGGINDPQAWIGDNEIRSRHPAAAMAMFSDGHVRLLSETVDRGVLGGWITRNKREVIDDAAY